MTTVFSNCVTIRFIPLVFLLYFSGIQSAFSITLPEAISFALKESPEVLIAQKHHYILEHQIKQVYGDYFPTVDFSAGFGHEQSTNASTRQLGPDHVSLPRTDTRIAINQMLFDGFSTANEIKRVEAKHRAAKWLYEETVQAISMDAINRYLAVQKQRELLGLVKKFSEVQAGFLVKIQGWYTGGAGTIADVWQTESRLALTKSSVATNESKLASAMDAFVRLFGFAPKTLAPSPTIQEYFPASLAEALRRSLSHHPSLKENRHNLEASQAELDKTLSSFFPSVNLALESNRNTNTNGVEGDSRSSSAMIRINYNLFQGGTNLAARKEASSRMESTVDETEKIKRTLQEKIELSWRTLEELRERLTHLQHHVKISKQVVGAYYEQFFADKRSLLNVLNAENELFTAQTNRVKGHYALLVEKYKFLANLGTLNQVLQTLLQQKTLVPAEPSMFPKNDSAQKPAPTITPKPVINPTNPIVTQEDAQSLETNSPSAADEMALDSLFDQIVNESEQMSNHTESQNNTSDHPPVTTPKPEPLINLTTKKAIKGDAQSQYHLGVQYDQGEGINENNTQAASWYRKAAEQGHAEAQNNLGVMYHKGFGVPQDYHQAMVWYRKAAEQGHINSQFNLGLMYDRGQGMAKDNAQAIDWYQKAAEQGHHKAQFNLGIIYYQGQGVSVDHTAAYLWFHLAALHQDEKAAQAQEVVATKLNKTQLAEVTRLIEQWQTTHNHALRLE